MSKLPTSSKKSSTRQSASPAAATATTSPSDDTTTSLNHTTLPKDVILRHRDIYRLFTPITAQVTTNGNSTQNNSGGAFEKYRSEFWSHIKGMKETVKYIQSNIKKIKLLKKEALKQQLSSSTSTSTSTSASSIPSSSSNLSLISQSIPVYPHASPLGLISSVPNWTTLLYKKHVEAADNGYTRLKQQQ
jgi:hypothetical protein